MGFKLPIKLLGFNSSDTIKSLNLSHLSFSIVYWFFANPKTLRENVNVSSSLV